MLENNEVGSEENGPVASCAKRTAEARRLEIGGASCLG